MNTYVINLNGKYIGEIYADKIDRSPTDNSLIRFYMNSEIAHARIWLEDGISIGGLDDKSKVQSADQK
jgi:hypothetical protein